MYKNQFLLFTSFLFLLYFIDLTSIVLYTTYFHIQKENMAEYQILNKKHHMLNVVLFYYYTIYA